MEGRKYPVKCTPDSTTWSDGSMQVRLINRGWFNALPAGELKVGMHRMWNYDGATPIVSVERKGQWVTFRVQEGDNGQSQRLRFDSPVPVQEVNK